MGSPLAWLCFLCTTKVTLCGAYVWTPAEVFPDKKTWTEGMQNSDCHLLGRAFIADRLEDVRVQGVTDNSELSTQYWIGAHVQYSKWMRFSGCYQMDIQQMTSEAGSYSITECYKFCDGTSFGLTIDKCVCLDTPGPVRNTDYDYCMATPCQIDVGEFCGDTTLWSKTCLCWYDVLDLRSDNRIGNCKSTINRQLTTTNCSDKHAFLCQRRNKVRRYQEKMNWTEAGFACHRDHRSQFFDRQFPKRKRSGRYWVGLFRKQSFSWGNSTPSGKEFDCLSASVSKDGKLNTFVRKCYSRLPLLCNQPEPKLPKRLSTLVFTTTETVQTTNTAQPGGLSVISLSVGVVCGILVTLLAVVIFVIIYRFRKKRYDTQASSNRQEVASSDIAAVHYEHIRPENRECQVYDVCGHTSATYDYITTQGGIDKSPE
ncbi:uncharacterized protein LOC110444526 [Mizuhopecten yessoensis]|uniref:WSC domain-containing protein n=1 Tax=Mizuhopecten yessoensis TaxID=6573 RepID=A0A210R0D4_MIZYE|nr:uncharacterized protein LOC110444526 [Mizuhopecten yessoensis]OWF54486.1 hypothetical protein KP79_PYT12500 [Mizuhopecten yessoensis]